MRMSRVLVASLIVMLAAGAAPAAEPLTARIEDKVLTLTFPADTLPRSVSLQLDGRDVPSRLFGGSGAAVHWEGDRDLVVDLHRVKRAIGARWVSSARVWGQKRDGQALLQNVALPDHRANPTAAAAKSPCCGGAPARSRAHRRRRA